MQPTTDEWLDSAQAVSAALDQWRLVGSIISTSQSKDEALERLSGALGVSPDAAESILDQPFGQLLPERRRLHNYRIRQRSGVTVLSQDDALKV